MSNFSCSYMMKGAEVKIISASIVLGRTLAAWFIFVWNNLCISISNVRIYLVLNLKHWLTRPKLHRNLRGTLQKNSFFFGFEIFLFYLLGVNRFYLELFRLLSYDACIYHYHFNQSELFVCYTVDGFLLLLMNLLACVLTFHRSTYRFQPC